MKWFNKLRLVFRMYANRGYVTLVMFGMCAVSFFMIDRVITEFIGNQYEIWQVEESFAVDTADAGNIHFSNSKAEQEVSNTVYEYMRELEQIEFCGYMGNATLMDENDDYVSAILVEKDIIKLGTLGLSESQMEKISNLSDDEVYVLFGWNYRNTFPEGKYVKYCDLDEIREIPVDGVLKKGAKWVHEQVLFGSAFGEKDNFSLDDSIIVVTGSMQKLLNTIYAGHAHDIYFKCQEGDFDEAEGLIKKFCYENDISVFVNNYADEINEKKDKSNILDDSVFVAAIMIIVLAIVSISAANVVYCIMCKRQYGIMMANGMSKSNIIWIILVQNLIVMCLAAVSSWIVRQRSIFGTIFAKELALEKMRILYGNYVAHVYYMPVVLVCLVSLLLIITCAIPIVIIEKNSLADLISGKGA
ncbi:MAG: ABC transporter permease [Lachnospira sp.]